MIIIVPNSAFADVASYDCHSAALSSGLRARQVADTTPKRKSVE